jgi:hypothetical protein
MGRRRLAAVGASAAILALAVLGTSLSVAEVSQKGGVRVTVKASLAPTRLPRKGTAPVSVSVAGQISPLGKGSLPQLKTMKIELNSAGQLDFKGIPHCRINHINPSTDREALAACGDSLIGEGNFSANVILPEQSPFPSEGKLLAFNGTIGRRPAIFAHIYGTKPLPTSYVFAFRMKRQSGTFGSVLEASFPEATDEWGYITAISLKLNKRLVRAGCPAPGGLTRVPFPLARTSFDFAGGLSITNTLTRSCEAQG